MCPIEAILYFDPQQALPLPCPRCRLETYPPTYSCPSCEASE